VATNIDALRIRHVLGRSRYGPPEPFGPDGWRFVTVGRQGAVIVTRADVDDVDWVHASMSWVDRLPTWDELGRLRDAVFGDGWAYQVFAPSSRTSKGNPWLQPWGGMWIRRVSGTGIAHRRWASHTRYNGRVKRAYRFRFYPTPEQASELNRTFGCVRYVWNWALDSRTRRYRVDGERVGYHQLSAELTALKKTGPASFLGEVSCVPLQQVLRHQQTAFNSFFAQRARYPRFKSRDGRQSAEYTSRAFRWRGGRLFLAKLNDPLDLRLSRPVPDGDPSTVTVSRDRAGRWHVSMLFDEVIRPLPPTGQAVGIDLGLKDFAVTSDGEHIPHPQHLRRKEKRLVRYQRMMARKVKGSANRAKARVKVAKTHAKVTDARRDFLHKTSTAIVAKNDVIVIEDLNVAGMVKNHRLAKSIGDSGWSEFRQQLEYKAQWYGRHLVVVDRFYPSSKLCSHCGHLLSRLSLGTRHWTCPTCRTRHDRDVNAAKNILAEGLSVASDGEACGADVRPAGATPGPSAMNQETHSVRSGIPRL